MSISDRTFGVELEILLPRGVTRDMIAQKITEAGYDSESTGYTHRTTRYWKVTTDGSVSANPGQRNLADSAEIVAPILSGEAGIVEARAVADILRNLGCKVNKTCGFHCHVGAGDLTADMLRRLALNFIWFEDFFDHIMPPSRRANNGEYVNSNRARVDRTYGTDAVNAWFPRLEMAAINASIEAHNASVRSSWQRLDFDTDIQKVIYAVHGSLSSRYFKMNLTSLNRQPTVEFRQHSGTVDADKVENWIRMMVGFVEKSIVSRPRPRTVTRDLTPAEEMSRFFAYMGAFIPAETKAYYAARRLAIANEARVETRAVAALLANAETETRSAIATLTTRRERALAMRRPQIRVAQRLADQIQSLDYSIRGSIPYGIASRDEAMSNAVRRARAAFPDLLTTGAVAPDRELAAAA